MLFRILEKPKFKELIEIMMDTMQVVGPTRVGIDVERKPIHQYLPIKNFAALDLSYETTDYSAKTYFLPFQEKLCTYSFTDDNWEQNIKYRLKPRALVGLHACDINGLVRLDKVLARGTFPSPYYVSRRRNTLVVGIDHPPCNGGFCYDLGTDTVTHGFDLYLTDLGDRYFVAIGSDRGYTTLKQVEVRDVEDRDNDDYLEARRAISSKFKSVVNAHNLPNLLDIEFESDVWRKWGEKCLSCGSCAMTCPTCYCYGILEDVSMDLTGGSKKKQLYSCNIVDFAEVAGGHNFRSKSETRLKYRYYHQHRGFVEAHEEPKCVGCGRCGRACLAGINPPDVIGDLQAEKLT
ncbi:MAG: 4Fe-4S dicluster domain-containing protein [Proteobacteria bacterium]|nr:4Fe-4S dicluster domain-containing protein [Pseudomonadota bacterium]